MKIIKALCYISISIAFLASGFLLVCGVLALIADEPLSSIQIMAGVGSFLVVLISAYPIFALGIAEEKIEKLEQEVRELKENTKENNRAINRITLTNASDSLPAPPKNLASLTRNGHYKLPTYEETVGFVNKKYGLSLSLTDDLATIKQKIEKIEGSGFSVIIFKRKVREAISQEEIEDAFVTYKVAQD